MKQRIKKKHFTFNIHHSSSRPRGGNLLLISSSSTLNWSNLSPLGLPGSLLSSCLGYQQNYLRCGRIRMLRQTVRSYLTFTSYLASIYYSLFTSLWKREEIPYGRICNLQCQVFRSKKLYCKCLRWEELWEFVLNWLISREVAFQSSTNNRKSKFIFGIYQLLLLRCAKVVKLNSDLMCIVSKQILIQKSGFI